ncbi:Aste57867_5520 [Aphanomyces stellatus]|uniref:Aste57867_5520 protein n=1 Tax=Aphanomyces stellatus TaxID=120398 RepID=A0A485KCZ1_9STRA|nr:hypothetical protein As57867_005507 [Aphanomyces stellatus]VFT82570.1 Aste57867_5520 [Aphanomyces stellatus]
MAGESITIMDATYVVASRPQRESRVGGASKSLYNHFYMDIIGVRNNFDNHALVKALRRLKTTPLFQGHRSTIPGTSCHSNVWRVYFCSHDVPNALVVNGHPVDQIKLDGVFYAVFTKDYMKSPHPKQGGRSVHFIDLDGEADGEIDQGGTQSNKRHKQTIEAATLVLSSPDVQPSLVEPSPTINFSDSSTCDPRVVIQQAQQPRPSAPSKPVEVGPREMEFEEPRKPKRKARDISTTPKPWATLNFFDPLQGGQDIMHPVKWPYALPIRTYVVSISFPTNMSVPDDAHIKRMGISNKKLDWHPDNMTLAQIVQVIQDYNATTPPTQEDQLTDILEVSKHLDEDFRTPIDHTKADDLWQWVSRSPLHANVKLTTLLHEGQPALDRIIRLHAWHRWTVASLVPQTTTFLRGFQHAFGVKPTWDFMSALSATPDFTQYEGALPDATVLDIEDALAAFELWFAMQVDTLFRSDEWVVFLTKRPVMWLPASKAPRMLSADTIFNLIHSTFGTHFVAAMAALWPCRWVNTLHQIQQMNFRYSGQGTMLFSDSPQLRLGSPTQY